MEDIILETVMFKRPPEWGRRVIQRGNEVLLQTTDNGGIIWVDAPIPEIKLIIPVQMKSQKSYTNKYSDISFYLRDSEVSPETKSTQPNAKIDSNSVKPEILESINSGNLLTVMNEDGVEVIKFLGVYRSAGLGSGQVWRDSQNYLRIVP
ncbi:MAG: hypothetical protein ACK5KL_02615 [Dysgonomonas sp.]